MDALADNFRRLMGLHALRISSQEADSATILLGLSSQLLSELQSGRRQPSLKTVQRIASFFEITMDRLLEAPFEDLLANELSDPERYRRVEEKKHAASKPSQG
jgi:transcriptional regulator with XRE-family HTH domain